VIGQYRTEFDGMWNNADNFKTGDETRKVRQAVWDRLKASH
jgi:hypothetical protein